MLYRDQTIKNTSFGDMWMTTISDVSVATIAGYNYQHTPRHRIKESLDVSLGIDKPIPSHDFIGVRSRDHNDIKQNPHIQYLANDTEES
ncbi:hypothetical protein TNCV_3559821 [Trichonephila clavipes]|uniref:Uncharacterized protein n=1 Tax=Trichonephila clavipes TaxID=2585209 RepID=A0A8X6WDM5_TRICX|nr:hypothetical protein TNCV_3559821 [Trichonephila clavipes]